MKLSLVPIDGERVISDEEKERMKRRVRQIPLEVLGRYDNEDRKEIKEFLASLMILSEQIHHDMKEHAKDGIEADPYDKATADLQAQRQALFDEPTLAVRNFIELLQFYPMEPWPELEMMIASIRGEDVQHHYDTKVKTAADPPDMDAKKKEIERAKSEQMQLTMKCRPTAHEIKELVQFHSLESLVKHLIEGRRLASGAFWNVSHYDF